MHTCTQCHAPLALWVAEESPWGLPCPHCGTVQGVNQTLCEQAHLSRLLERAYQAGGRQGIFFALGVLSGQSVKDLLANLENMHDPEAQAFWLQNYIGRLKQTGKLGEYLAAYIQQRARLHTP